MLASSRDPATPQTPGGGRKRPPYIVAGNGRRQMSARCPSGPPAGRWKSSVPTQGLAAACHPRRCRPYALYCRAGVHARRKGLRWPGRILAGQSAAPLRLRLAAHPPPLAGEAFGGLPFERLPCKGLRSRAPPAAEKARRSRCSGRRMQACFSMRRVMRAPQTGNGGEAA